MRPVYRSVSRSVDKLIVLYEGASKGRKRHAPENIDLSDYNRPEYFESPEKFYNLGCDMPELTITPEHVKADVRVSRYSFKSETVSGHEENDTVVGRIFRARDDVHGKDAPCAIVIHGWRESGAFASYYYLMCWLLARYGINCVMYNQPYHGPRTPRGSHDGDLMMSADMEQTVKAFRQSVCDVRSLLTWTSGNFSGPVGLVGLSLGGFISLLTACADDRPKFVIPVIAAGDLLENIDKSIVGDTIARDLKAAGISLETVEKNWRVITPCSFKPKVSPDNIYPIAGEFDMMIPIENVVSLQRKWGIERARVMPCGHIAIGMFGRTLVNEIADFIRDRCGLGNPAATDAK